MSAPPLPNVRAQRLSDAGDPALALAQRVWFLLRQQPGYVPLQTIALRLGEPQSAVQVALSELVRGGLAERRHLEHEWKARRVVPVPDDAPYDD